MGVLPLTAWTLGLTASLPLTPTLSPPGRGGIGACDEDRGDVSAFGHYSPSLEVGMISPKMVSMSEPIPTTALSMGFRSSRMTSAH